MTVSLTKRFSHNFQSQANYTFSKTIDDIFDFGSSSSLPFPTRRYLERSISSFDIRHNFVASGVINLPFKAGRNESMISNLLADTTISPIVSLRTGVPFNLFIGSSVNGDLNTTDRPFYAPRNSGTGPNFYSVNLRLNKRIYFTRGAGEAGVRLEFLAETTNLLNRTNFLRVNDVVGTDPRFLNGPFDFKGSKDTPPTAPLGFTAAHPPRQFQFGLKMAF